MNPEPFERARDQAEICRLFGNPTRVMIVWVLHSGERQVGDIAARVDASPQSTSQHLRLMRDRGILAARREGKSVMYRLRDHENMHGCRLLELATQMGPKLADEFEHTHRDKEE
jgi:DNA-binding transcriptional ArsR family regulator